MITKRVLYSSIGGPLKMKTSKSKELVNIVKGAMLGLGIAAATPSIADAACTVGQSFSVQTRKDGTALTCSAKEKIAVQKDCKSFEPLKTKGYQARGPIIPNISASDVRCNVAGKLYKMGETIPASATEDAKYKVGFSIKGQAVYQTKEFNAKAREVTAPTVVADYTIETGKTPTELVERGIKINSAKVEGGKLMLEVVLQDNTTKKIEAPAQPNVSVEKQIKELRIIKDEFNPRIYKVEGASETLVNPLSSDASSAIYDLIVGEQYLVKSNDAGEAITLTPLKGGENITLTKVAEGYLVGGRNKGTVTATATVATKEGIPDTDSLELRLADVKTSTPAPEVPTKVAAEVYPGGVEFLGSMQPSRNASVGEAVGQTYEGKSSAKLAVLGKYNVGNFVLGLMVKYARSNDRPTENPVFIAMDGTMEEIQNDGILGESVGVGVRGATQVGTATLTAGLSYVRNNQDARSMGPGDRTLTVEANEKAVEAHLDVKGRVPVNHAWKLDFNAGADIQYIFERNLVQPIQQKMHSRNNLELYGELDVIRSFDAFEFGIGGRVAGTQNGSPSPQGGDVLTGYRGGINLLVNTDNLNAKAFGEIAPANDYQRQRAGVSLAYRVPLVDWLKLRGTVMYNDVNQKYDGISRDKDNVSVIVGADLFEASSSLLDADRDVEGKFE